MSRDGRSTEWMCSCIRPWEGSHRSAKRSRTMRRETQSDPHQSWVDWHQPGKGRPRMSNWVSADRYTIRMTGGSSPLRSSSHGCRVRVASDSTSNAGRYASGESTGATSRPAAEAFHCAAETLDRGTQCRHTYQRGARRTFHRSSVNRVSDNPMSTRVARRGHSNELV